MYQKQMRNILHYRWLPLHHGNIVHFLHSQDFLTEQDEIEQQQDLEKINLAHVCSSLGSA
jgi:hypothetical protein